MKRKRKQSKYARTLRAGELLFREGDPADCAYVIEHGELEVFRGSPSDPTTLDVLGPGEIIGEMAAIDGLSRTASGIARTKMRLRVITAEHIRWHIDAAAPLVQVLLKLVLKRYRSLTSGNTGLVEEARPEKAAALARSQMSQGLEEALDQNGFVLHFQPVVELKRMTILGFEALLRWNQAKSLVYPSDFMEVLEDSDLIHKVGRWALKNSCATLARFNAIRAKKRLPPLFMAVNMSARQLANGALIEEITQAMSAAGIRPQLLQIEITESALVDNMDAAIKFISRCHELGIHVAVDDFGTGYSSLNYLHRFAVDTVKIDRSFVTSLSPDSESTKILHAIKELASALKMRLIAEGVEDRQQANALQSLGIELAQGYLFSRPIPEAKAIGLLTAEWPWSFDRRAAHRRMVDLGTAKSRSKGRGQKDRRAAKSKR